MRRKPNYSYGRRKEKQVARRLRRKGYKVTVMKGSRGPSDIKAKKGPKKWNIQVKATRKKKSTHLAPRERRRLKIQARKEKATPVHAEVKRGKVTFNSVRTKRKLKP